MRTALYMIETAGPGGAETMFAELIRSLDPSDWRAVVVVPERGWLYDRLVKLGIEPIVIKERHRMDPRFLLRIAKVIRDNDVDIIHAHLFGSAVRAGFLSMLCRIPAVATLHGIGDVAPNERFRALKVGLVNRGIRRTVFVSETLRRSFLSATHLRADRTLVIPNGIDVDRFSDSSVAGLRNELGIAPDEFVVGAIGNPGPAKGYDVLLRAAQILKRAGRSCRFVIVGDLEKGRGAGLVALRQEMGLTHDVVLAGFRDDLPRVLATFDAYALTSSSEGFSLAVVEAMAAGLPVVATRCGGPEEILENGVTGVLVENGSADAVAAAIQRLRGDAGERRRLGDAARTAARENFRLESSVRAYERLYDECLTGTAPSSPGLAARTSRGRVLVTDGEQRAALAAVRALGLAGFEVYVCSARLQSIAGESRFCKTSYRVADPLREPDRFLADLLRLTSEIRADVLLPVTEPALLAVLPNRQRFGCAIPFADAAAFEAVCDKLAVLAAAKAHGIATPLQAELAAPEDVSRLNGRLQFPLVLKPCRSIAGKPEERIHTGVTYAESATELVRVLPTIPRAAYPVLLQQRIEGPGVAISVLVWDGELLCALAHRRIREKPPSGGVSVLRESIAVPPDLLARSLALLRDFNWRGVAMVEYKLDDRTGVPYLMEINGRLWGSLQLAIDSGVDFPTLLVETALGMKPTPVTTYEIGVRSRWEWGDVDNLLANLFHSSRKLSLGARKERYRRIAAVGRFVGGFAPRNRPEVFRYSDPRPFIQESKDWVRGK